MSAVTTLTIGHAASAPRAGGTTAEVAPQEWEARVDLAACYRLAALHRWDDSIATHISARVPGEEAFLINPYGMLFEEITASSLVKVDLDGNILSDTPHDVNRAGFVIHSAIHAARDDAGCVMHLHTDDGVAVSCLAEGLLPINQTAMLAAGHVAYHDYEGVAVDEGERARLQADLGQKNLLILRNHGTLTVGRTVAEAYTRMFVLERACTIQVRALSMGRPLMPVSPDASARTSAIGEAAFTSQAPVGWAAARRMLDRHSTEYQL